MGTKNKSRRAATAPAADNCHASASASAASAERAAKPNPPGSPIVQLQEIADQTGSNCQLEMPSRGGSKSRTKASRTKVSRASPLPRRGKPQQSETLVRILTKNKSLVYACLMEDGEDSEAREKLMKKVTRKVTDDRFQTWPKILRWMTTYHNKLQREKTSRVSTCASPSTNSLSKALFKNNLSHVLNSVEMNKTSKAFLNSLLKTIGKDTMTKRFNRYLRNRELPDDISSLIFSPLFIKIRDKQVEQITSTKIDIDSDMDDLDDELSDWSKNDNPMHTTPRRCERSSIDLGLVEDYDGEAMYVEESSGSEPDKPTHHAHSQRLSNTPGDLARQSTQILEQPDEQDEEESLFVRTPTDNTRSPLPQTPIIMSFSQPLPKPDSQRGSTSRIEHLAPHLGKEKDETGKGQGCTNNTIGDTGQKFTTPRCEKRKQSKQSQKTKGQRRGGIASLPSPKRYHRSLPKVSADPRTGPNSIPLPKSLVKDLSTPEIIRAENRRQAQRLAKPLAPVKIPYRPPPPEKVSVDVPQRRYKEIRPEQFYAKANSQLKADAASKPVSSKPYWNGQASKQSTSDREKNAPGGHQIMTNSPQGQPASPRQDSLSVTPVALEAVFRPMSTPAEAPRGKGQKKESAHGQPQWKSTSQGEKKKKRSRNEQECEINKELDVPSLPKHIRFTEEDESLSGFSVATGKPQSTPTILPNSQSQGSARDKPALLLHRNQARSSHRHYNTGNNDNPGKSYRNHYSRS